MPSVLASDEWCWAELSVALLDQDQAADVITDAVVIGHAHHCCVQPI
jgi:hypothetical protein